MSPSPYIRSRFINKRARNLEWLKTVKNYTG